MALNDHNCVHVPLNPNLIYFALNGTIDASRMSRAMRGEMCEHMASATIMAGIASANVTSITELISEEHRMKAGWHPHQFFLPTRTSFDIGDISRCYSLLVYGTRDELVDNSKSECEFLIAVPRDLHKESVLRDNLCI